MSAGDRIGGALDELVYVTIYVHTQLHAPFNADSHEKRLAGRDCEKRFRQCHCPSGLGNTAQRIHTPFAFITMCLIVRGGRSCENISAQHQHQTGKSYVPLSFSQSTRLCKYWALC